MIAAIVLAGGASVRMGTPKALLRFRGTTFLQAILDAGRALGLQPRLVVLGHDADNILSHIELDSDVVVAISQELHAGPIGSIRAGIRQLLNHSVEGALIWHVDRPHIQLDTIRSVIDAFRTRGLPIALPLLAGRRGHPVLFGRSVFEELLAAPNEQGARAVIHAEPSRIAEVPVDDPAVLEDIGTPEAYQELLRRIDGIRE